MLLAGKGDVPWDDFGRSEAVSGHGPCDKSRLTGFRLMRSHRTRRYSHTFARLSVIRDVLNLARVISGCGVTETETETKAGATEIESSA